MNIKTMKKLSIEEKAKRFDEVLVMAEECITNVPDNIINKYILNMFPELQEDEDEKIRKALINGFKDYKGWDEEWFDGVTVRDAITWLEKQGESNPYSGISFEYNGHTWGMCARDNGVEILVDGEIKNRVFLGKPQGKTAFEAINEVKVDNQNCVKTTDEVEPKFKVGDWIISDTVNKDYRICKITSIKDGNYTIESTYGYKGYNQFDVFDNVYRLWTIEDTKDGDILAGDNVILMFRRIGNTRWPDVIDYHCYYDCYRDCFIVQKDLNYWGNTMNCQLNLATKEQCDILFQKMKEAGYEWDAEKKELKKIENKNHLLSDYKDEHERGKADTQKSIEWSKEDKDYYDAIIAKLEVTQDDTALTDNQMNFLKSLKDRIGK